MNDFFIPEEQKAFEEKHLAKIEEALEKQFGRELTPEERAQCESLIEMAKEAGKRAGEITVEGENDDDEG